MSERAPANLGVACTRARVAAGDGERTALRIISADGTAGAFSYRDLDERSDRAAALLLDLGLGQGDILFLQLSRTIEHAEAFLGALKARVAVASLFPNIGDDAIVDRLGHARAAALLTRRRSLRRILALRPRLPDLRHILVADPAPGEPLPEGCLPWPERAAAHPAGFPPLPTDAATPALLHYTSGSTGKPKGIVHGHGAGAHILATTREALTVGPDDRFWCTADPAWITGAAYGLLGPWLAGATAVHHDAPYDAAGWMALLEREAVTVWYTAPTALRMLMREDPALFARPLPALRHIASVGEPLNPEILRWSVSALRRPIHDTWFQTETGGIMIAHTPAVPPAPGSMGKPVAGVEPVIVDDDGAPLPDGSCGHLCVRPGWPSMFRACLHDPGGYAAKFRAGLYWTGDRATRGADGLFRFHGRADDVINTAGHLISPFEVESALLELPEVLEAGAVAMPDPLLHEAVAVFVRVREVPQDPAPLQLKLRLHVQNRVATFAAPREVRLVDRIPKNRSGKILRRVLKAWLAGEDPGDLSTMEE